MPSDADSLADLMRLPTMRSTSGMVKIEFNTDHSVALTGFAFRFFALHRYRGRFLFGCYMYI